MAGPQSIIGDQSDLAPFSNRSTDEPLEVPNELVGIDCFWVQFLSAGKGEKLCCQFCTPAGGLPCGCRELPDAAAIRCAVLDELEVSGDHHEQIVEVVGHTASELADGLHFLALMKLLLDQAARFHSVLVLGDVLE